MTTSSYSVVAQITSSPSQCVVVSDPNGNHDSGYAPSNIEDAVAGTSTPPESPQQPPHKPHTENGNSSKRNSLNKRNGFDESPKRDPPTRYCFTFISTVAINIQLPLVSPNTSVAIKTITTANLPHS